MGESEKLWITTTIMLFSDLANIALFWRVDYSSKA